MIMPALHRKREKADCWYLKLFEIFCSSAIICELTISGNFSEGPVKQSTSINEETKPSSPD